MKEVQIGPFIFFKVDNGVEVNRVLNAMQTEYVGTLTWAALEELAALKPKPADK